MPGLSQYASTEMNYGEFRNSIIKRYVRNSLPIVTTWLGILGLSYLLWRIDFRFSLVNLGVLIAVSSCMTLFAHRLLLLIHEGSHFQFAKSRFLNDVFTNFTAGLFLGTEVGSYRKIHTLHHRNLGNSLDPENSYENEFDFTWIVTVLSGLHTLKTIKSRESRINSRSQLLMSITTLLIHSSIICFAVYQEKFMFVLIWTLSWFFLMPALAASRNLIEHRFSDSMMNFELQETLIGFPNVTTRLFTKSKSSKLLGSVGFDRHLLHHWDPSISAKDLKKVHEFLSTTELGPMLEEIPSTYFGAAKIIWKKG